MPEAITCCY